MSVIPDFEDKALIDLIRNYPCLYFHLDKNYKKNDFKELSWTEIATQLECPGTFSKFKIILIRL